MIGAAETIAHSGGQIAIMGQGEAEVERALGALASRHPGNIAIKIGFDEGEARTLFAGSDFLLMPSRFEPCGLSQMYAQRFGSLPIARRTGGLADSIEDGLTGFLFKSISGEACQEAIGRALNVFDNSRSLAPCAAWRWRGISVGASPPQPTRTSMPGRSRVGLPSVPPRPEQYGHQRNSRR